MDLANIFFITTSIFAVVASVFLILFGYECISFLVKANRIAGKIEDLTTTTKNTVIESGDSIKAAAVSIEQFIKSLFTVEAIKKTAIELIKVFKKKEGEENEKGK